MNREIELIAALTPLIADLAEDGEGAVALAGSRGRGRSDAESDFNFRVYADAYRGPEFRLTDSWKRFEQAVRGWRAKGSSVEGVWIRRYAGVQRDLDAWLAGVAVPKTFEWTIWGYHLPTDLASQRIIADPRGLLAGWKQQLAQYPEALRASVLRQNMDILRYWAKDYHYESKVVRRDLVFLVGLTGKLANAILQSVFALNRAYYPGDGWNLPMAAELERLPPNFLRRMAAILEPGHDPHTWRHQRTELLGMIADLEALIAAERAEKLTRRGEVRALTTAIRNHSH